MHQTDFKMIKLNQPAGRCYTAGANLSWVSPWWTPCSVPVIQSAINLLVNSKFREPKPLELTVMVNAQSDPNNQQHKTKSMLKRLSAEEEHVSYIIATWRDVSKGEKVEAGGTVFCCSVLQLSLTIYQVDTVVSDWHPCTGVEKVLAQCLRDMDECG